jgi:regulator of sirC expression with transglutaminase-like and TPR domain
MLTRLKLNRMPEGKQKGRKNRCGAFLLAWLSSIPWLGGTELDASIFQPSDPDMIVPDSSAPWWHRGFAEELSRRADLGRAAILLSAHFDQRPSSRPSSTTTTTARNASNTSGRALRNFGDVELAMTALDDLAYGCGPTFADWHRRMFVESEFSGNGLDYHDPRNSFLPHVLERKVGIPISLATVGLELAKRIGLTMWGVGMPGHFLLGTPANPRMKSLTGVEETSFIDPFNGGTLMGLDGCSRLLESMFGKRNELDPSMLAPVSTEMILIRMTNNLKSIYARDRNFDGLTAVLRLRSCLPEMSLIEGCELIRLLDATGSWLEARSALTQLFELFPEPTEQATLSGELGRLTARLN